MPHTKLVSPAQHKQPPFTLWTAGAALALLSAASMAFEVTLTHLFSEIFQYHFAFLAVSTAILGLGLGASIGYRISMPAHTDPRRWFSRRAALIAAAVPLAVILFVETGFVPGYVWQILLGALPFLFVGLLTARLYQFFHGNSPWLYAFDLGGAALGLFGILLLLNLVSAASAGILLGILPAISALLFAGRNPQTIRVPFAALLPVTLVFFLNLFTHLVDLPRVSAGNTPPDKTMYGVLANNPGSKIVGSAYSSYARVDLVTGSTPQEMYAFTNAGAGSYMLAFNGDLSTVNDLQNRLEYLPFLQFQPKNTLILGSGAGKDILQALLAGSTKITAVEVNPAMVEITRRYGSFNGNIQDYPGVTTVVADGRDYVHRSTEKYDMIYLNLVYSQAPAPGSNALSEAYIFTTEAFRDYWTHLSGTGRLAIVAHQGLEGSRAMITALQALEDEGIAPKEALTHMALLMLNASDVNQSTSLLVVQKTPLTSDQINLFNQAGAAASMSPLYLPTVFETLFRGLNTGDVGLKKFLEQDSGFNLFPSTDNRPFFFNLNPGLPQPIIILLVIAAVALALYLLSMLGSRNQPRPTQLIYFGALGIGYFMIEMPLIQRSQLTTGNPTLAMVTVLAALLLGGGVGSYLSSRWSIEKLWPKIAVVALSAAGVTALLAFFQPALMQSVSLMTPTPRLLLTAASILPLGILLGMPFANGLRLAGDNNEGVVSYLWGWNAVTSVAGSALAAALAMLIGFQANLLIGAGCYLIVALTSLLIARRS